MSNISDCSLRLQLIWVGCFRAIEAILKIALRLNRWIFAVENDSDVAYSIVRAEKTLKEAMRPGRK